MREDFNLQDFMLGLPTGIIVAGIIFYFVWRKGKKERRYDERYKRIHQQAQSLSWGITTLAIVVAWAIVIIFEGPKLGFFILTALYVISMGSYIIGSAILGRRI